MKRLLYICVLCAAGPALAQDDAAPTGDSDRLTLKSSPVTGNKELPKVLYIVPWKDPSGMPKIDLDPEFTEAQIFRRLYPPAYKRELDYYELLEASEKE